jgi:hypothetical protein
VGGAPGAAARPRPPPPGGGGVPVAPAGHAAGAGRHRAGVPAAGGGAVDGRGGLCPRLSRGRRGAAADVPLLAADAGRQPGAGGGPRRGELLPVLRADDVLGVRAGGARRERRGVAGRPRLRGDGRARRGNAPHRAPARRVRGGRHGAGRLSRRGRRGAAPRLDRGAAAGGLRHQGRRAAAARMAAAGPPGGADARQRGAEWLHDQGGAAGVAALPPSGRGRAPGVGDRCGGRGGAGVVLRRRRRCGAARPQDGARLLQYQPDGVHERGRRHRPGGTRCVAVRPGGVPGVRRSPRAGEGRALPGRGRRGGRRRTHEPHARARGAGVRRAGGGRCAAHQRQRGEGRAEGGGRAGARVAGRDGGAPLPGRRGDDAADGALPDAGLAAALDGRWATCRALVAVGGAAGCRGRRAVVGAGPLRAGDGCALPPGARRRVGVRLAGGGRRGAPLGAGDRRAADADSAGARRHRRGRRAGARGAAARGAPPPDLDRPAAAAGPGGNPRGAVARRLRGERSPRCAGARGGEPHPLERGGGAVRRRRGGPRRTPDRAGGST